MIKKDEGENMAHVFEEKYKELKIVGKRERMLEAHYMGSESISRQRYARFQSRGRSNDRQGG